LDKAAAWLKISLDYEFAHAELLDEALTHRSATHRSASGLSNERLEFLGDAVLDFVISHAVYVRRPAAPEGDLSRLRASLVKDTSLARIATVLGLGEHLNLGSGERKTGGHHRASILADALEALFGAIYLDRGFDAAEKVILHVFREWLDTLPDSEDLKDPKTRLQELLQGEGHELPLYTVTRVAGQQHRQTFEVACKVAALDITSTGSGSSRRSAEQAAAAAMLELLRASKDAAS
jgi:ribonuclease-3